MLHADLSKGFILAGTSAGANLASVAAHLAVDKQLTPEVTGVVLLSPALCHHAARPAEWEKVNQSWEEHRDAMVLDRRGMEWFYGMLIHYPRGGEGNGGDEIMADVA